MGEGAGQTSRTRVSNRRPPHQSARPPGGALTPAQPGHAQQAVRGSMAESEEVRGGVGCGAGVAEPRLTSPRSIPPAGAARGAAASGHPRRHLLGGSGQRHRVAPGAGAAGGGGRGRRRVSVSTCGDLWVPVSTYGYPWAPRTAPPHGRPQVLVLLRAREQPPALVFGTPPEVVPRCRLLPGWTQ